MYMQGGCIRVEGYGTHYREDAIMDEIMVRVTVSNIDQVLDAIEIVKRALEEYERAMMLLKQASAGMELIARK